VSPFRFRRTYGIVVVLVLNLPAVPITAQQPPQRFGGAYSELDARRQRLIADWVARFVKTTGQTVEVGSFYDDILSLSTKTTFDAVTHALMTSTLTDASGARLGDVLGLVERLDNVRGEIPGAPSDRQFRMYARLTPNARDTLDRSREFKRKGDNSVYHKGYPLNYREEGTPSIQVSMAPGGRQADIDVDYRSSSFPVGLFNGHLTASNSDVRAGDNSDRHASRWTGLQSWWRGFLGVRLESPPGIADESSALSLPRVPRAGKKKIDVMAHDFLHAWLVEGAIVDAMGFVSERAYACLAQDAPDPDAFDRGLAPVQLLANLKAAHDALGAHPSLDGLIVGVRLTTPALKVVSQPHHAQFVIYDVPDDVAAAFDCESRLMSGTGKQASRSYGHYFGSTFYLAGRQDTPVALLWAMENGYWKIVSWRVGVDNSDTSAPAATPDVKVVRIKADPSSVEAARGFLETWLIRKDYDAAFRYLSTKSYACYDLVRNPSQPAATSLDDAGRKIRESLQLAGKRAGEARKLETILAAAEPLLSSVRVMDHAYSRTFSLTGIPTVLADASECDARARGAMPPESVPLEYGEAFGTNIRFRTTGGEAPVLRLLWRREQGAWRITSYEVEAP